MAGIKRQARTARQQQVHDLIKRNPNISYIQIAKRLNLSVTQVEIAVAPFTDIGEDNRRLVVVDWRKR